MSERQACRLLSLSRSVFRYEAQSTDDHELAQELLRLAECQPHWGCGKMVDYLKNQGYDWNHKRIRRVYREFAPKTEETAARQDCSGTGGA
jgi:putative transposase